MNILFVHDHVFHWDSKNNYYSGGGLPKKIWQRYLAVFNTITVVGRKGTLVDDTAIASRLALSSSENVSFCLLDNISTVKTKIFGNSRVKKIISELVSSHDAVIARLTSEIGLLAIKEAKKQNKPYAIELVDCPWDALWNYGTLKAKLYAPILTHNVKRAMRYSKFSLYVTKDFLQNRYPSPFAEVIDCSNVQISQYSPEILNNRLARIRNNDSTKTIKFGLIGSLHGKMKGIDVAIKALSLSKQHIGRFEFHILGAGDASTYRQQAKYYGISNSVFFDGVLPSGDAVFRWLDNIDIYLHPSYKEGLPRALIEAMSRGCPALATNVAGTPELLTDEYLINSGDYKKLSEKIITIHNDSATLIEMATNNFKVTEKYTSSFLDEKRKIFLTSFLGYIRLHK